MRLETAKNEVLERISKIIGVKISEDDLTFFQKQVLTSIAETLRQLIIIKQIIMIEQTKQNKLVFRIAKKLKGKEGNDEILNYLREIDNLQKILNTKIKELANNIIGEKSTMMSESKIIKNRVAINVIQPLQCTNCGARLKVVSFNFAECEYCGMKYTMGNYLQMLKTSIEKA